MSVSIRRSLLKMQRCVSVSHRRSLAEAFFGWFVIMRRQEHMFAGFLSAQGVESDFVFGRGAVVLGVYDLMALISAICLIVATILLVIEIRNWGQFPGFPWRVDTARATPVSSS